MTRIVIYTGPSLPPDEARAILPDADIRPPVQRDDLLYTGEEKPDLIGIIDGELYTSPTVSPKEILTVLYGGAVVLGGAGMGALRAAELHASGMVGIGMVFNWYRHEKLNADDAVFAKYDPDTYVRMSDPLVNMIFNFSAAELHGIISCSQKNLLVNLARNVYFSRRSYSRVFSDAGGIISPGTLNDLQEYISTQGTDLQKRDAICLLHGARYLTKTRNSFFPPQAGEPEIIQ